MRIAVTGGTGFVGGRLARSLAADGHEVILVARGVDKSHEDLTKLANVTFIKASIADEDSLVAAFEGCQAVAHCAGINRQIGNQRYEAIHVEGTRNVLSAAKRNGVERIALISYLRARPNCGSEYLQSKWESEEITRHSGVDYLILKPGVIYGRGDHLIDHTSKSLGTFRFFSGVGLRDRVVRPVFVDDVIEILRSGLVDGRLLNRTITVAGPEELKFGEIARRVAKAMDVRSVVVPLPIPLLYAIGGLSELLMKTPLVSLAQVRLLREGSGQLDSSEQLPNDLVPETRLTSQLIERELPYITKFTIKDLRWFGR